MSGNAPALLSALARAGMLVAVVGPDGTVEAAPEATRLGDLAALARAASGQPVTVQLDGRPWEARAPARAAAGRGRPGGSGAGRGRPPRRSAPRRRDAGGAAPGAAARRSRAARRRG